MEAQFAELAGNPDAIVATPGRLAHHIEEIAGFSLAATEYCVFDEADRYRLQSRWSWHGAILFLLIQERQHLAGNCCCECGCQTQRVNSSSMAGVGVARLIGSWGLFWPRPISFTGPLPIMSDPITFTGPLYRAYIGHTDSLHPQVIRHGFRSSLEQS